MSVLSYEFHEKSHETDSMKDPTLCHADSKKGTGNESIVSHAHDTLVKEGIPKASDMFERSYHSL